MYSRILDLGKLIQHRSLFLFGSRQTGKSTLLHQQFPQARFFDLLEADTFRQLSARPELIRQSLNAEDRVVIIDEVQKLPSLLDEVHLMIERRPELRFILTGSSARKLKRGGANLLAGRAWICRLHPLVYPEIGELRLLDRLNRGSLPAIIDSPFYQEDLNAYVGTYLQEEIQAEGLARSVENFSRFLNTAGQTNGEPVNFTSIGQDSEVPPRAIREHYQILEDTLVGSMLPAYTKTIKRKAMAKAKFYFFDVGIANTLMRRGKIEWRSEAFGRALEHLIFLELRSYLDYRRKDLPLRYWRSRSQLEVDFVIGDHVAIEVKSKAHVSRRDFRGLLALDEELNLARKILVCTEKYSHQTEEGIEVMGIHEFLARLWEDKIIN